MPVVPSSPVSVTMSMVDAGSWGLRSHDDRDGRVFGLCTESLGSESSWDDASLTEEEGEEVGNFEEERLMRMLIGEEEPKTKKFPPPLPSLSRGDGRRCSFMKAVRKDGCLLLKEVRIQRPEILRATREDGHLKLEIVRWPEEEPPEEEEVFQEVRRQELKPEEGKMEEAEEEERRWRWPMMEGEKGNTRRCQEVDGGANNGDHIAQFWKNSPWFVTTA